MALGRGREVKVFDGAIPENGHGFPAPMTIGNAGSASTERC